MGKGNVRLPIAQSQISYRELLIQYHPAEQNFSLSQIYSPIYKKLQNFDGVSIISADLPTSVKNF